MNREQRRLKQKALEVKTGQQSTKRSNISSSLTRVLARYSSPKHHFFALCIVGLISSMLIALCSMNTAISATPKDKTSNSTKSAPITVSPSSFPPSFASLPHQAPKPVSQSTQSSRSVLEADLKLDLSKSNDGRTFNVGRIAPCSQMVLRANYTPVTVGELKVDDEIRLTGGNVGRVISIKKKWHSPTATTYVANGNRLNRVIATTKRMTDRILYLYTSVEVIKTTPEHPFAVKDKGFVKAEDLHPKDRLETNDGKVVTVERTEIRNEPQLVYDLEVENAHNFFVGKNAILVHNGGACVPSFGMATYGMDDLTAAGGRAARGRLTGKSQGYLVYIVHDLKTGEFLKVGQTNNWRGRFSPYRTRALREGREILINAFEVDEATARGLKPYTLESEMQRSLFKQGHALPWDESKVVRDLRNGI